MNLDSLTLGLMLAVTLAVVFTAAGWAARGWHDRRKAKASIASTIATAQALVAEQQRLAFPAPAAPAPRPAGPPAAPMVLGAVVEPTTRIRPVAQRTPEMAARASPDRLRPATVPPAPKPRIQPKPQQRGRHWPADINHTGAIPIVQKETAS